MKTKACTSEHSSGDIPAAFFSLPSSQASKWRHVCAACAYELGRKHAAEVEENLRKRVRELQEKLAIKGP